MRKIARPSSPQAISIRRSFHGLYIPDGIHPFEQSWASCPAQRPDCCWTILRMIVSRKFESPLLGRSYENARNRRAYSLKSTTNVVLLEQRLVTRLVLLLDVIEKGTTRRHQLQQATTRMIVLHVGLEVPGQVVDAFRQDSDLNFGRAGVTGLVGTRLDDVRFAFGGNRHRE